MANSTWFPSSAVDATAFSLVYGLPLLAWAGVTVPLLKAGGTNTVYTQRNLLSANFTTVVSPNGDTLYQDILVDLSHHDLVITVANVSDDRFWAYSFYDPYGNNFANVGSVTQSPPGQYGVHYSNAVSGVEMCNSTSLLRGIITSPTTYSLLIGRIYVRENTVEDLEIVHRYQDELTATVRNRTIPYNTTTDAPDLSLDLLAVNGTFPLASQRDLELLARLAPDNQPVVHSDRLRVASMLAASGIYDGHYHPQPAVNLATAQGEANATIKAASIDPSNYIDFGNDWYADALDIAGNFGTRYAYRAFSATELFLELESSQALYPRSRKYYGTGFVLEAGRALLFTFSDIPPVHSDGFWSLTAYNGRFLFVPNAMNRYEVGTRQNLTFDDETYGYPIVSDECGMDSLRSFKLLLQAADEVPPSNWSNNWLPTVLGGGELNFNLRFYDPTPALTNGSYAYPIIEQIPAIQ